MLQSQLRLLTRVNNHQRHTDLHHRHLQLSIGLLHRGQRMRGPSDRCPGHHFQTTSVQSVPHRLIGNSHRTSLRLHQPADPARNHDHNPVWRLSDNVYELKENNNAYAGSSKQQRGT